MAQGPVPPRAESSPFSMSRLYHRRHTWGQFTFYCHCRYAALPTLLSQPLKILQSSRKTREASNNLATKADIPFVRCCRVFNPFLAFLKCSLCTQELPWQTIAPRTSHTSGSPGNLSALANKWTKNLAFHLEEKFKPNLVARRGPSVVSRLSDSLTRLRGASLPFF